MVKDKLLEGLIREFPYGFVHLKLIYDPCGEVEDLLFLKANSLFETLTGFTKQQVLNKKVTESFPALHTCGFDWISSLTQVAQTGKRREFIRYSAGPGRWLKVTAFTPRKGYLSALLQDVTEEMDRIKALEEEKAERDIIFNSTQDAMFLVQLEGDSFRYIRNNVVHQKQTGLGDVKGKTPVEALGEVLGKTVEANYRRCAESGKPTYYEQIMRFPAGEQTWFTTLTPVFENGRVRYLVGSGRDISEQKKLQAENNVIFKRLQAMFYGHSASMLIIDPNSGAIRDANPAALQFYGYSRDELLRMKIQDINTLPEKEQMKTRMMAYHGQQQYFQFPHRLKGGERRLVDVCSCPVEVDGETLLYSIVFDVSERESLRQDLYREKELLRTTLYSIGDGVITTDTNGEITSLNTAAEEITGFDAAEVKGRKFSDLIRLFNEETGLSVEDPVAVVLRTGQRAGPANHTTLLGRSGRRIPIADSAAPIRDGEGNTFGVVMTFRDVSREKKQKEHILFLSYHDPLTGLFNRRFVEEHLRQVDTVRQLPLAVIMGDVNGLKITNDVFSHETGDKLLKKVSEVFRENSREDDILARWGGDEFIMLLPRTDEETVNRVISRFRDCFAEKSAGIMQLSVSLGGAVKKTDGESIRGVLQEAEERMYHQKLVEGKNYRKAIVKTLLQTLYEKSHETEEHAVRLKNICCRIGRKLKLTPKELGDLSLLATLHDIGKVAVRSDILKKPAPLNAEEWEQMKKHSEVGYRIAQNASELSGVAEYILYHHEHWDGSGYPRGLKGDEIPLLCRILAVADAYDAMTSDRVYRDAMTKEEALEELERCSGTQFEAKIVKIFLKLEERG